MKRLLLLILTLASIAGGYAQETKTEKKNTIIPFALEKVRFYGYGQAGFSYSDAEELKSSNTFDIKRIIVMADAQVTKDLRAYFMYDFGPKAKLHEYWAEYHFADELKLKFGQQKTPFSIENLMSNSTVEIIDGAQSVGYLAGINGSDAVYGGNAGRDLGVTLSGDLLNWNGGKLFTYQVGLFNGQGLNQKDLNSNKDFAGWLMVNPCKHIRVGGSIYRGQGCSVYTGTDASLPESGVNYKRNRWSLGTEITTAPVYVRAEYLSGQDADTDSEGYYATANIHLSPKVDVIASYDYFNKNKLINDEQTNYILGLQYNFFKRCRLQGQYIFQDRSSSLGNANVIQTQLQIGF